jgi:hypothetical protein
MSARFQDTDRALCGLIRGGHEHKWHYECRLTEGIRQSLVLSHLRRRVYVRILETLHVVWWPQESKGDIHLYRDASDGRYWSRCQVCAHAPRSHAHDLPAASELQQQLRATTRPFSPDH